MDSSDQIRGRLLKACDEAWRKARAENRGSGYPNPSKRIAEGIDTAWNAIKVAPVDPDPPRFLASLKDRIEELRVHHRENPTSRDGDTDEDGYVLGGLATIAHLVEAEAGKFRPSSLGWWKRFWGRLSRK